MLKKENAKLKGELTGLKDLGAYQPLEKKMMNMYRMMIKQKFDMIEFVAGGERGNVYKAYPMEGKKKMADS